MPKFAANLSMMFTEVPFLDRFEAAAKAGFKAVEYLFPYEYPVETLVDKLQKYNLEQVLFNTCAGNIEIGEWGLNALPGREEEARENLRSALAYAIKLKCPSVHVMSGVVPEGEDNAQFKKTFIENMRYAAELFSPYGINLLIEALSPLVKPNYLFSSQYQSLELIQSIDRPNVFIQLDLFHAQIVDGNLTHLIKTLAGKYSHIQIASVPDRHEPNDGEINYSYLFSVLDSIGYSGWIGCEYNPANGTEKGLEWIKPYFS